MYISLLLQTNYTTGDNNQLLDTIGDSNSSSSFDMERRSFSSNSNQSTLGNYNSDHSTVFSSADGNTKQCPIIFYFTKHSKQNHNKHFP